MDSGKKLTYHCSKTPTRIFKYFQDLKNKNELCDITLQIGKESISAHRIIISAVIPYFRGILAEDKEDITIPDIEPNALKCLVEFAYSCEIQIDAENVRNLLAASCYLGVNEVRDACSDFLIDSLEYDNVLNIREFADSLNRTELLKCIDIYIKRNFEQVSQTKGFLQCPLIFLEELIGKDDINVYSEEKVFEAVINWVKNSPEERGIELPELMRKVRMPLVDPLYLTKIVEREEIIRSSLLCRDLIDEAKNYVQFPELRKSACSFVTESRRSMKTTNTKPNHCLCGVHGEMKFTARHFDFVKKKWHIGTRTFCLYGLSSAAVNKKIYFFHTGGTKVYDPANNCYEDLKCMQMPRTYATATALKNQIYVCGGEIGSVPSDAVESFDPEKNEWRSLCFMKISCWGSSSVALGDYIFILGGVGFNSMYDTVQRYDSVMDKWKIMSSMLTKRAGAGAATLNGKIYICGGYVPTIGNDLKTASETGEVYDPIENTWAVISNMTAARTEFTLLPTPNSGELMAVGGLDRNSKYVKTIGVYSSHNDLWTEGTWDETEVEFPRTVFLM